MHEKDDTLIFGLCSVLSNRRKCSRIPEFLTILRPQGMPVPMLMSRAITHAFVPSRLYVIAKRYRVTCCQFRSHCAWDASSCSHALEVEVLRQVRRVLPKKEEPCPSPFNFISKPKPPARTTANTAPTLSPKTHSNYPIANT